MAYLTVAGEDLIIFGEPELSEVVKGADEPVQWSNFLGDVHNYVIELMMAANGQGHMISAPDITTVALRQLDASLSAATSGQEQITQFERVVFDDSRPFGRGFNEGRLSLEDALRTVDETARFREWLAEKPDDADLLKEFHAAVIEVPRLKRLPATITRFAFFGGLGALLSPGVGLALSTLDQFVVDKVIGGWNPGAFVTDVNTALAPLASNSGQGRSDQTK